MSARDLITGDAELTAFRLLQVGAAISRHDAERLLEDRTPEEIKTFAGLAACDESANQVLDRLICSTKQELVDLGVYGLISDLWFRHPRGWSK